MWYINEERQQVIEEARVFAQTKVRPAVKEMEKGHYPLAELKALGEKGFLGLAMDETYGGANKDYISYGLMLEEIAKESHAFGLLAYLASQLTAGVVYGGCSEDQVETIIKPALKGEKLLSIVITEPTGAGNANEYDTVARLEDDEWVINGSKILITNADVADIHLVVAVTGENGFNPLTGEGISVIAVPADTEGFSVGHIERKLGWHGSHTGQIYFDNCRVPKENVIWEIDQAWMSFNAALAQEFAWYGPMNLGAMEAVYDKTNHYLHNRFQNGSSLWDNHESIRMEMASMWMSISNYRAAVYSALESRNKGQNISLEAISLKVKGEALLTEIAGNCMELQGGNGTMQSGDIERYYRDSKMGALGCGSNKTLTASLAMLIGEAAFTPSESNFDKVKQPAEQIEDNHEAIADQLIAEIKKANNHESEVLASDVLICGGRGVVHDETWENLETLCQKLEVPLVYTRPVIDYGKKDSYDGLIGASKHTIRPKLLINFGVSGAPQVVHYILDSEKIISVNTNEQANIFNISDVKIIDDAKEIIKVMLDRA